MDKHTLRLLTSFICAGTSNVLFTLSQRLHSVIWVSLALFLVGMIGIASIILPLVKTLIFNSPEPVFSKDGSANQSDGRGSLKDVIRSIERPQWVQIAIGALLVFVGTTIHQSLSGDFIIRVLIAIFILNVGAVILATSIGPIVHKVLRR